MAGKLAEQAEVQRPADLPACADAAQPLQLAAVTSLLIDTTRPSCDRTDPASMTPQ
jgi:hypothetical protein